MLDVILYWSLVYAIAGGVVAGLLYCIFPWAWDILENVGAPRRRWSTGRLITDNEHRVITWMAIMVIWPYVALALIHGFSSGLIRLIISKIRP